jgi:tetratricopeptide (TPR) repeat protein
MRPNYRFFVFFLAITAIIAALNSTRARAEILKAHEPKYSLAVLAYNERKYDESIKILNQLLTEAPNLIEFLELKALALKSAKNDAESAKTYLALIEAKTRANAAASEIAPYHFELGVIQYRSKDIQLAKPHFEYALTQGFNVAPSSFFLGMIAFQENAYSNAIAHFEDVSKSNQSDLRSPALFYLAQSYLKSGDSARALASFSEARTSTDGMTDEVSKAIHGACDQVLNPLDQSRSFASLALSLSYDSNVQALPNILDGTQATNKASVKNLLQAGFGYMTSPTKTFQWVPNYRLLYNYDYNRDTRSGEFLNQYLSLYLNHKALERSAYGFKLNTSFTFQNQLDTASTQYTYRIFSLTGDIGAYYRTELGKKWSAYFDVSTGPQRYFTDTSLTESEWRTGSLFSLSTHLTHASLGPYLNPTVYLTYLENSANGYLYYSKGASLSLVNGIILNDKVKGSVSIAYSPTFYTRRSRTDRNYALSLEGSYQINSKWSVISDASLSYNASTDAAYEYRRWTLSSGLSYSFY